MCLIDHFYLFLRNTCSDLLPIFQLHHLSFYYWVIGALHTFEIWALYQIYVLQIFSLRSWVIFTLSWCRTLKHKSFNFDEVQSIYFFITCAFDAIPKKSLHNQETNHKKEERQRCQTSRIVITIYKENFSDKGQATVLIVTSQKGLYLEYYTRHCWQKQKFPFILSFLKFVIAPSNVSQVRGQHFNKGKII